MTHVSTDKTAGAPTPATGMKQFIPTKQIVKMTIKVILYALLCSGLVFLLLCFVIALVLGGLWNPFVYMKQLEVVVVNNDVGVVGSFMTNNFSSYCPYGVRTMALDDPKGYIGDARAWFLLHVPSGFSDKLMGGLNGTVTIYENNIELIVDEGRSYLVLAILEPILIESVKKATDKLMLQIFANTSLSAVKDLNVLLNPVSVKTTIVHPDTYFGQDIATGLLNVFVFILTTLITLLTTNAYMAGLFGKINFVAFYAIKQVHNFFNAVLLSATITVALLCFSSPFYESPGLYFLFYLLAILTIINLIELALYILRQYTILFALAFAVLNFSTSTALVMYEIQHPFYQFGYGLLMYNIVNGARYIMFGSDNKIGLYVGVLVIWLVCCWTLCLIFYIAKVFHFMRMQKKLASKQEQEAQKQEKEIEEQAGGIIAHDITDVEHEVEKELQDYGQNTIPDPSIDAP
jgi:uncharacterized membrane protein YciS (DUF1049 family)